MNPPPPPPTPFPNPSSFTFPPSTPTSNPNPNFFHPQRHLFHPPSCGTTVIPAPPDLPTTLATLKDLIQVSETTIHSVSSILRTTTTTSPSSSGFCTCPFNSHHRMPPESLFLHSLRCPSSPSTIDLSLLESLHYPNTLQSSDALIKESRFIRTLHDADVSELCFSLDDYGDLGSNFFYRDCPGVVTLADQKSTNRTLTLPGILSAECANFKGSGDREVKGFSTDCLRLLPSELWYVRSETEAWIDFPTSYSHCVLRAILCSHMGKECDLLRWVLVNSSRYGVVIDVPMRDHIFLLFRLCFKAITTEAIGSTVSLFNRELEELNLKTTSFKCPILAQVWMWFASQLTLLYGEANGKLFAVDMLKQCLLNALILSEVQNGTEPLALKEGDDKLEEPLERSKDKEITRIGVESMHGCVIFVSQVAAAVAALHERSLLEEKIKALRYSHQLARYPRMAEHAYVSNRANEERQKRLNYRPILEHDGLLWQRARNQEANKMKSREELLAEERDYKRRRMSYRGKKMKRTTTQVMGDIIEEYMEEIKQAGGFGYSLTGAEEAGTLASEPFSVHDNSTENEKRKSLPDLSEVSRGLPHGYRKQLRSHNNIQSTRIDDESPENNKRYRHKRDSHGEHGHLEDQIGDRNRHEREYYCRSSDGQGHSRERIINRGQQDGAEVSRKYSPHSPDRSHSTSLERTSHRRDRVDQNVEYKDRRRKDTIRNHRSNSVTRHEFEDREYDYRSSDGQGSNGHSCEQIINRGQRDAAEVSRKYSPQIPDRSHNTSLERTSHRRDRVDQNVEDKDRRRRNTIRNHRSNSVTRHEFEDRYDPSSSRDMSEDDLYSRSKYIAAD